MVGLEDQVLHIQHSPSTCRFPNYQQVKGTGYNAKQASMDKKQAKRKPKKRLSEILQGQTIEDKSPSQIELKVS